MRGLFGKLPQFFERARPSSPLSELLKRNQAWANEVRNVDGKFFERLARQQTPKYMWIGCADARVPANTIVGLPIGSIFVHRNVANLVNHTDFNCLSAIEYAVKVLKVEHVLVVGHYGCAGVRSALSEQRHTGLVDNWLRHIRDVRMKYLDKLEVLEGDEAQFDALCELNVLEQVKNVAATTAVQDAWARGQRVAVHGWIYRVEDGLVRDLGVCVSSEQDIDDVYLTKEPAAAAEGEQQARTLKAKQSTNKGTAAAQDVKDAKDGKSSAGTVSKDSQSGNSSSR